VARMWWAMQTRGGDVCHIHRLRAEVIRDIKNNLMGTTWEKWWPKSGCQLVRVPPQEEVDRG